jgi:hypothetical protein
MSYRLAFGTQLLGYDLGASVREQKAIVAQKLFLSFLNCLLQVTSVTVLAVRVLARPNLKTTKATVPLLFAFTSYKLPVLPIVILMTFFSL